MASADVATARSAGEPSAVVVAEQAVQHRAADGDGQPPGVVAGQRRLRFQQHGAAVGEVPCRGQRGGQRRQQRRAATIGIGVAEHAPRGRQPAHGALGRAVEHLGAGAHQDVDGGDVPRAR
jgi:hypothetical protein